MQTIPEEISGRRFLVVATPFCPWGVRFVTSAHWSGRDSRVTIRRAGFSDALLIGIVMALWQLLTDGPGTRERCERPLRMIT